MIRALYNNVSAENTSVVTIRQLHDYANTRLSEAHLKLDPTSSFSRAAKNHSADSIFGSILLNAITWGLVMQGFDQLFNGAEAHGVDLTHFPTALEAADMFFDETVRKQRRKLDNYPEGRRNDPIQGMATKKRFNLVASNENTRFTYDAKLEIAALSELMDMLELLAKQGVSSIAIDASQPVHKTLKAVQQRIHKDKIFTFHGLPVRKAV